MRTYTSSAPSVQREVHPYLHPTATSSFTHIEKEFHGRKTIYQLCLPLSWSCSWFLTPSCRQNVHWANPCSPHHAKWVRKTCEEPEDELSNAMGARCTPFLLFGRIYKEVKGNEYGNEQYGSRWTYKAQHLPLWSHNPRSGPWAGSACKIHRGINRKAARHHLDKAVLRTVQWCSRGALTKSPSQLCPHKLLISNKDNHLRVSSSH